MRSFVSYICGFCKCKRQKTDRWLADNPDLSGCANMVESPRTGFTSGECIFYSSGISGCCTDSRESFWER